MTAFELMNRMTSEEQDLWAKYDQYYHSEAERLNAELRHTVYCNTHRKGKLPKPEVFARILRKDKPVKTMSETVNSVVELRNRLNKQLGIQ